MVPDQPLGQEMSEDAGGSITGTRPWLPWLPPGLQEPREEAEDDDWCGDVVLHHGCLSLYLLPPQLVRTSQSLCPLSRPAQGSTSARHFYSFNIIILSLPPQIAMVEMR